MSRTGDFIKKRREELGLSQTELADLIGESKQTLWKYESGTITNIPLPKVEALAVALRCSPSDIAGWTIPITGRYGNGKAMDLQFFTAPKTARDPLIVAADEILETMSPETRLKAVALLRVLAQPPEDPDGQA